MLNAELFLFSISPKKWRKWSGDDEKEEREKRKAAKLLMEIEFNQVHTCVSPQVVPSSGDKKKWENENEERKAKRDVLLPKLKVKLKPALRSECGKLYFTVK